MTMTKSIGLHIAIQFRLYHQPGFEAEKSLFSTILKNPGARRVVVEGL
jgi:hypothetical protein